MATPSTRLTTAVAAFCVAGASRESAAVARGGHTCRWPAGNADFAHQVLLEDQVAAGRELASGRVRQQPGQLGQVPAAVVVGVHRFFSQLGRAAFARSPVTCSRPSAGSRSAGTSFLSLQRARDSRDRTVPTGTPSALAAAA